MFATLPPVAPSPPRSPLRPRGRVALEEPRSSPLAGRLLLLGAIAAAALSVAHQFALPDVVPSSAPTTTFSAARAFTHVRSLASAPRPVGSMDHTAARAYLVDRLYDLRLAPAIQATASVLRFPDAPGFNAGSVRNVVARLPGYASTGAIVLNAHYDGARTGPAAGDCGACVAAVLETVRALERGPQLRNDVIVVFSDAEEVGDLGAHAFATQHPWMRDVRVALNFEAMGTGGPVSLYATSRGNRALVRRFADVAPNALVSPLLVGLVRGGAEPRAACDLQDYLDGGSAGLGFLFAGNSPAYHTVLDNPATLDLRTLQQGGDYALSLVRALGNDDLDTLRADTASAVFFNVWRGLVVSYPTASALPLAAVAVLLFVAVMSAGLRRRRLTVAHAALGALAFLETVVATAVVVGVVWWGVRALSPDLQVFQVGHHGDRWFVAGLMALGIGCAAALSAALGRQVACHSRLAGALAGFAVLAVVSASAIPEVSYAFAWPLVAGTALLAWLFSARRHEVSPLWTAAGSAMVAVVAVVLLLPLGLDLFTGFMRRVEAVAGIPALAATASFVILLAALLAPLVGVMGETRRRMRWWILPVGTGFVSIVLFAVGTVSSRFSGWHPRPEQVRYELDADRGVARWVSSDRQLGPWARTVIAAGTPAARGVRPMPDGSPRFAAPAPFTNLAPPTLEVRRDSSAGDIRWLRLRLASSRAAPLLEVRVESDGLIAYAAIAGEPLDLKGYAPARDGRLAFNYAALPDSGVDLALTLRTGRVVRIALADSDDGLPSVWAGGGPPRRSVASMPAPGGTWDGTIVRRTVTLLR